MKHILNLIFPMLLANLCLAQGNPGDSQWSRFQEHIETTYVQKLIHKEVRVPSTYIEGTQRWNREYQRIRWEIEQELRSNYKLLAKIYGYALGNQLHNVITGTPPYQHLPALRLHH